MVIFMKIFKDSFTKDMEYNKYFNGQAVCFLDIETTGFSRKYNFIYLIGIVFFNSKEKRWELIQIFAENINSEKEILLQLIEYVKDFDLILTYNGDSFDIPFINSRLELYSIDFNLFSIDNYDIYKLIKENKIYLEFENYKLKTIERNLQIFRDDIYSGGDCIQFYKDYVKNGDVELLDRILQHNYDDLFYLVDIIKITDMIDDRKSIHTASGTIMIDCIAAMGDIFSVEGYFYGDENVKLIHYDALYSIDINKDRFEMALDYHIGLVSPKEKGLYIDKNNFALEDIPTANANYTIPDRFLLLQVGKKLFLENIKHIVSSLIDRSMQI